VVISSVYIQLLTVQVFACAAGGKLDPTAVSVQSGKTYEQEFAPEIERAQVWHLHFFSAFKHMCIPVQNGQTVFPLLCRLANQRQPHGARATALLRLCYMVWRHPAVAQSIACTTPSYLTVISMNATDTQAKCIISVSA